MPPEQTLDVAAIDAEMLALTNPERAAREKAYLKSDLVHYGLTVPTLHRIAKASAKPLDHDQLVVAVTELWDEPREAPVHERRFVAADMLANRARILTPDDLPLVEHLLREARTWAIVDTLAPWVVGYLAERYPDELTPVLDAWVHDDDFWMRRTVLLCHLIPLREGRGDWQRFTRYADDLLNDSEFFVAKALGWVLRDTGRRRPEMVLAWIEPRIAAMQTVSCREALKPLAADDQERLRAARGVPRHPPEP